MRNATPQEILQMTETWTRFELPAINRQIEGRDDVKVLIDRLKPLCDLAATLINRPIDNVLAARLLQCLAFGVSSVERHMQWSGHEPGEGVLALGATGLLLHLARLADQPPRDTYRTYWLDNPGAVLTFTGSYQEAMFNRIVNETETLHAASAAALRRICNGEVPFESEDAIDAMEIAIINQERLTLLFKSFMERAIDRPQEWAMTPEFFAFSMRTYLCTYPVGDTPWGGPNAANIPGQVRLDYAIGTVDDDYRNTVLNRFPLLHEKDRLAVADAMAQPSLVERVLETIGVKTADLAGIPDGDLVPRFRERSACLLSLDAFGELIKAAADLSATHFSLIHNYLRRQAKVVSPEIETKLPVKLGSGTGHMDHDATFRIMNMRKNHPIVRRVVAEIRTGR